MFFALNSLPPVSDKSKAFYSRVLLVPLNRDFSQSGALNVDLKSREWTKEEMTYLVKLAVEGLKRLMRQGDFTKPTCVIEALQDYEKENNPVLEFLSECGEIEGEPTGLVYEEYRRWCEDAGHKNIFSRTKFTKEVTAKLLGYKTESIRHSYFGGNTGRCFVKDW